MTQPTMPAGCDNNASYTSIETRAAQVRGETVSSSSGYQKSLQCAEALVQRDKVPYDIYLTEGSLHVVRDEHAVSVPAPETSGVLIFVRFFTVLRRTGPDLSEGLAPQVLRPAKFQCREDNRVQDQTIRVAAQTDESEKKLFDRIHAQAQRMTVGGCGANHFVCYAESPFIWPNIVEGAGTPVAIPSAGSCFQPWPHGVQQGVSTSLPKK